MAETEQTDDQPGVFGNLPRSRPAHRSPLREGRAPAERARETAGEEAGERPPLQPRPKPRPSTPQPGPDRLEPETQGDAPEERIGGLEDLAWAGIAVAAEAATLGVRLAGRAFEAAREAVERR